MTAPYIIRDFNSDTAVILVEYTQDNFRVSIVLQLDSEGNAPTGTALDAFVMMFKPSPQPLKPVTNAAEIQALVKPAPPPAATWDQIRQRRNELLYACDWTQCPDTLLTPEQVQAWRAYRSQLRDITNAFTDPSLVVWPTVPQVLVTPPVPDQTAPTV